MIKLHAISPENEMRVAEQLKILIMQAWPDVTESRRDHIDILVGLRLPADVDILVIVDLDRPHNVPSQIRRLGGSSAAATVQYGLIAIEIKQLDTSRFDRIGNQWFPVYNGVREDRSVSKQAFEGALSVATFGRQLGQRSFVHNIAWLTEVDDDELREIDTMVLGRNATWFTILDAAMQQHPLASQDATADLVQSMMIIRERLLARRKESRRDRARVDRLSRDLASRAAVDELVSKAGSAQIRLVGRGGSGKTTSLALLAVRLAEAGDRVLILTFHKTLRSDIALLIASLGRLSGIPSDRILVETTMSFVLSALVALGMSIPVKGTAPDYDLLDGVLDETRSMLVGGPDDRIGDVARLRLEYPERFAWDHVFIDESQDCSDSERDFLRTLYGHRRLVLADGVDQLVRRQVACDWNQGIAAEDRFVKRFDSSLRMLRNVAMFVNCVARALGFDTWRVEPQESLPGGRVIIATGDAISPDVLQAVVRAAAQQRADPVDCLICVPAKTGGVDVCSPLLDAATSAGIAIWDGTLPENRGSVPSDDDMLRVVRYDSSRGLEGWITVALNLDDFAANKTKYPNLNPNDPPIDADIVAARWLLIPLTRAVHTLVITIRDPQSAIAQQLREATEDPAMPSGVVEWVDAAALARTLAPNPQDGLLT
jgi:hypothetical protein